MRIEFIGKTKATITAIDIQSLKMGQTDVKPAVCIHFKVTQANSTLSMFDKKLLGFLFEKGSGAATQQALEGIPVVSELPQLTAIAQALGALNWDGEQTGSTLKIYQGVTGDQDLKLFISREQMLALAKACDHRPTRAAIRIAFYSGMRISEIKRAERRPGAFYLGDTKNGEPRIVPMHPRVRCCAHYKQVENSATSAYFREARAKVGMDWLHFHDLRHSAASELINNKVDLYTVGAVLGHKSSQSTKRYAHLATDTMREAIMKIGQNLPHHPKKKAA